jgi:hypothetical protein
MAYERARDVGALPGLVDRSGQSTNGFGGGEARPGVVRAPVQRLSHCVPRSAATANPDVPTFAAIAGRSDTTAERLAGRIIVPHPPMPNVQLTVAEMRDIIAYILSLRPQR